ncbi:MAG: metalloregulator ArsR/SmtB family transcription factor [Acidimicrobiales bacterium]|nr:metalloregulator ArsR/SmtB family transcription factor [Acidimicrobiales bacterium]
MVDKAGEFDEDQLSRVFAALADPTRRDIVARLAAGDATVGNLAAAYDLSLQAVSKHLRVLTEAGLVTQRKAAQRRPCHLEAEVLELTTKWLERYWREAERRYQRLDAVYVARRDGAEFGFRGCFTRCERPALRPRFCDEPSQTTWRRLVKPRGHRPLRR